MKDVEDMRLGEQLLRLFGACAVWGAFVAFYLVVGYYAGGGLIMAE